MNKNQYRKLGDYIAPAMEKNVGLKIHLSQGICNNKYFQTPRQVAQDSENDQIVRRGQFAFNKATTRNGEKISIAYRDGEDCTVSSAYQVFYIKDEEQLNPYYLMMWFKRPEFDRYARFKSHGSAHEFFTYEEMCNVLLPVPSIEEQRRIVAEYQTVERRIQNNEQLIKKLEETAQAIYHHTFVEGIDEENLPKGWRKDILSSLGQTITGSTPSSDSPEDFGNQIMFLTPVDFHEYTKYILSTERCLSELGYNKLKNRSIPPYSVIVTCIGSDMGKVGINTSVCISNQQINSIIPFKYFYTDYLYYCLNSKQELLKAYASGSSTMPLLNKSQFQNIEIVIPKEDILIKFSESISKINNYMQILAKESNHLKSLLSLLTSKLS